MGLGPFHSFRGFHSHILLRQIEVFDWPDQQSLGEGFFTAHQLYQAGEVV